MYVTEAKPVFVPLGDDDDETTFYHMGYRVTLDSGVSVYIHCNTGSLTVSGAAGRKASHDMRSFKRHYSQAFRSLFIKALAECVAENEHRWNIRPITLKQPEVVGETRSRMERGCDGALVETTKDSTGVFTVQVAGGALDGWKRRYASAAEANRDHIRLVEECRKRGFVAVS